MGTLEVYFVQVTIVFLVQVTIVFLVQVIIVFPLTGRQRDTRP
jgi:hypothetical protein